MKSPKQNNQNTCILHHDKFQYICLHNNCQNCFKLLCAKCKKQKHYQHPNRVLQLKQFYKMIHKNHLNFVQNSLCMELISLKNKIIHVSNFRVFILQKQADLMENTKNINHHLLRILHQKQELSNCMQSLSQQIQLNHTDILSSAIAKLQKSISYNPISGILNISPDKIRVIKIQLQKCFQSTVTVINDLREYLIKIIQVLLSQEIQEDQIDYLQQDQDDNKTFNIQIKRPTQMQTNQKQPKYKIQEISSLYSKLLKEQFNISQQLENDVKLLQQQIRMKTQIVNNIRKRSYSNEPRQFLNDIDSIKEKNQFKSQSKSKNSLKNQNNVKIKDSPKSIMNEKTPKNPKIRSITQAKNQNAVKNVQTPKSPKNNMISPKVNKNNNINQKSNSRAIKQQNLINKGVISPLKRQLSKQIKQQSYQQNQSSNESFVLKQKIHTLQKEVNHLRKQLSQTLHLVQNYRITFNDDKLEIQQKIKNFKVQNLDIKIQPTSPNNELVKMKKKIQQLKNSQKKFNQQKQKKIKQMKLFEQKAQKAQQKCVRLQNQLKKQKQEAIKQKKIFEESLKKLQQTLQELKKEFQIQKSQKQQIIKQRNKQKLEFQKMTEILSDKDIKLQQLQKQHSSFRQEESKIIQSLQTQNKQLSSKLLQTASNFQEQLSSYQKNSKIEQKIFDSEENYGQLKQQYSNLKQKYDQLVKEFTKLKTKETEEQEKVKNELKNNQIIVQQQILIEECKQKIQDLQNKEKQLKQNLQILMQTKIEIQEKLKQADLKIVELSQLVQKSNKELIQKQSSFLKKQTDLKHQIKAIDAKYQELKTVLQRKIQQKLQNQQQINKPIDIQPVVPMLNIKSASTSIDMGNYVQIRRFKETRQMLEISIRKNNTLKSNLDQLHLQIQKLKNQNKFLKHSVEIKSLNENNQTKSNTSKTQESTSIQFMDYQEIKALINALTSDLTLLEEKVKQNSIIEKVYLKQLDRKRTQNRKLRQYVEELTTKQRQYLGIQTDRHFEKLSSKVQNEYKVHYATGFVGSGSRASSSNNNSTISRINSIQNK